VLVAILGIVGVAASVRGEIRLRHDYDENGKPALKTRRK
jgi:hypothetical protein